MANYYFPLLEISGGMRYLLVIAGILVLFAILTGIWFVYKTLRDKRERARIREGWTGVLPYLPGLDYVEDEKGQRIEGTMHGRMYAATFKALIFGEIRILVSNFGVMLNGQAQHTLQINPQLNRDINIDPGKFIILASDFFIRDDGYEGTREYKKRYIESHTHDLLGPDYLLMTEDLDAAKKLIGPDEARLLKNLFPAYLRVHRKMIEFYIEKLVADPDDVKRIFAFLAKFADKVDAENA